MRPALTSMSSLRRRYVSGLAQILITGEIAEPTTEPRPGGEERDVRAARDEFPDLLDVADIRKTPADLAIGHDIEQIQPGAGGTSPGLRMPVIGELPLLL